MDEKLIERMRKCREEQPMFREAAEMFDEAADAIEELEEKLQYTKDNIEEAKEYINFLKDKINSLKHNGYYTGTYIKALMEHEMNEKTEENGNCSRCFWFKREYCNAEDYKREMCSLAADAMEALMEIEE